MNILLLSLEDRKGMPAWYKCNLEAAGFSVMSMAGDGLFSLIAEWRPDVVLVSPECWSKRDRGTAQALKSNPATRDILVVEMVADEEADVGISDKTSHADVVIPFAKNPMNLVAHIQNLLAQHSPQLVAESYVSDNLTSSEQAAGIYGPEGFLPLSRTERRLLDYLMRRPGRAFTRKQLLHAVCGVETDHQVRTLDVYMARLRRVLRKAGVMSSIQTLRGVGYAFFPANTLNQPEVFSKEMLPQTTPFGSGSMRLQ